ncbi:MAG: Na+/H+ antiporter NhaA, partial [Sphingobacteriales bacterium]
MPKKINLKVFKDFVQSSNFGGVLLFLCVVISLIFANTSLALPLQNLLDTKLGYENETIHLNYSISMWINDGLMAIFFLLVGLEIKREIVEGELSSVKQASLPVLAAIGGVAAPALLYTLFNHGTATAKGWGIPMATDIAFALGILSLLGSRVPSGLKVFLAALAIVDDLMAILVIAAFYSAQLHLIYLLYASGVLLLLIIFNRLGIKSLWCYVIPGAIMWYFIH